MPVPSTPSKTKADEGINKIVDDLVQQWNLHLPIRDATWSPSKNTNQSIDQQILFCIRFLFFKDRSALDDSIAQFEKHARTIQSDWHFKPRAEADVIPSRTRHESARREELLAAQVDIGDKVTADLKECLLAKVKPAYDCVKRGEKYIGETNASGGSVQKQSESPTLPQPWKDTLPKSRTPKVTKQTSLKSYYASVPSPNGSLMKVQHPSSDDFPPGPDEFRDWTDIPMLDAPAAVPIERSDSTEEEYKIPPSQPSAEKASVSELQPDAKDDSMFRIPGKVPIRPEVSKKRRHPGSEPLRSPIPRKAYREKRNLSISWSHNVNDIKSMNPTLQTSMPNYNHPMHKLGIQARSSTTVDLGRSFSSSSMNTSFTTASTATTTPATSFLSDSLTTSFDSSPDKADDTIKIPLEARVFHGAANHEYPRASSEPLKNTQEEFGSLEDYESAQALDLMAIDSGSLAMSRALPGEIGRRIANINCEEYLEKYLILESPTAKPAHYGSSSVQFRQRYEVERISRFCKLPLTCFIGCLERSLDEYSSLWSSLGTLVGKLKMTLPERSSLRAWGKAEGDFRNVSLSGELRFVDQAGGPLFEFGLRPLKTDASYRLARKFGGDRIFILSLPGLDTEDLPKYLRPCSAMVRETIIRWVVDYDHYFAGRRWRAFYAKPEVNKKSGRGMPKKPNEPKYRIFMFAEDGNDFRRAEVKGEVDPRNPAHTPISISGMINWFMPAAKNRDKQCLKFFARLALAVSSTRPTVVFTPLEIIRSDDARADNPRTRRLDMKRSEEKRIRGISDKSTANVMNDGCARISRAAANHIAERLGLTQTPSVYQGRIGGAKGMWMFDALDEHLPQSKRDYWIEITDSQLKFNGHPEDNLYPDESRMTFEVHDYSKKLCPAALNFQLIPILEDRGVPYTVFQHLLEEDLTSKVAELKVAMADPGKLRKWNQDNNPVAGERLENNGVEMFAGLPASLADRINWFVEHGFHPQSCSFLKNLLYRAVHEYCTKLENRMHIGLGRSTSAYMIADPLAILEEGEVHFGFSNLFHDAKSGWSDVMLHDLELLVARSPALLPSDIQKVRAVFKTDLRMYKDVIVFSSKGDSSLADKLSGGDYDGDVAWICWEPDIVGSFQNAPVPPSPPTSFYGIEESNFKVKDIIDQPDYWSQFLRHAFDFNLQPNLLGSCTVYHESLCYSRKSICDASAIAVAHLLGKLVDRAKAGFIFDQAKWLSFLKQNGLPARPRRPAYKNKGGERPTKHILDRLVFEVAAGVRERALQDFTEYFGKVGTWDDDLGRIWNLEFQRAKRDEQLLSVRTDLNSKLEGIYAFWKENVGERGEELDCKPIKKGTPMTFKALVEKCRSDFLALQPLTGVTHPVVEYWRSEIEDDAEAGKRWRFIKASALFCLWHERSFPWHVAGSELAEMKAKAKGLDSYHLIVRGLYEFFKLDGKMMKRKRNDETDHWVEEDKSDYGSDLEDTEGYNYCSWQ